MIWLKTCRSLASLTCSTTVTSLKWPLKRFPWIGWVWTPLGLPSPHTHTHPIIWIEGLSSSVWQFLHAFSLHSSNTREPSQWTRRAQRRLLWRRWASCPSPLRSASPWTIPSSSWSMNTVQIAWCSLVGWLTLHRVKTCPTIRSYANLFKFHLLLEDPAKPFLGSKCNHWWFYGRKCKIYVTTTNVYPRNFKISEIVC